MKKKTIKNKVTKAKITKDDNLHLDQGIVIWITRSGILNASYFNHNLSRAFPTLEESLKLASEYFKTVGFQPGATTVEDLYLELKQWIQNNDQGTFKIVENN